MTDLAHLRVFLSPTHPCGYLPGRSARSAFADPAHPLSPALYQRLLEMGFRRSGRHIYQPYCEGCRSCVPVRVPAAEFVADRSQRRCLQRNVDLELRIETRLTDTHYALYRRYLQSRHPGAGMDADDRGAFHTFLECTALDVRYWCLYLADQLLAVAVVDHLPDALSAVYTFYDPVQAARGLGNLAVLRQIGYARSTGLTHVYLGYWIGECRKMAYKQRFHPLEQLASGGWRRVPESPE